MADVGRLETKLGLWLRCVQANAVTDCCPVCLHALLATAPNQIETAVTVEPIEIDFKNLSPNLPMTAQFSAEPQQPQSLHRLHALRCEMARLCVSARKDRRLSNA